jgi:hypothetical protein
MQRDSNPSSEHRVLLVLDFDAVMAENHRVLSFPYAYTVLFSDSPRESLGLLLRRRVERLIVPLQLLLPCLIFAFYGCMFAFPIQNKFRVACAFQVQLATRLHAGISRGDLTVGGRFHPQG